MKKAETRTGRDDLRREYDFSGGVRGKYAARMGGGANVVVLDPDVAKVFTSSESVNQALRTLAELARLQARPKRKKAG